VSDEKRDSSPPPTHWKPPAAWRWADPPPRHFVTATACGQARRNHQVTTRWDEVNCPRCLEHAPVRRNRK
jgi:hypothetical protein